MKGALGRHWVRFNVVSLVGVAVQAGVLELLLRLAGLHYLAATAMAVEAAVLHNFFWHRVWTWSDRRGAGAPNMLVRFHLTNGLSSLIGTILLMRILVEGVGLRPAIANLTSIALCSLISLINFVASDRLVFTERIGPRPASLR